MVNLIDLIDRPQGVHKIKTTIFSISLPKLRELQSLALESTNYDYESAEYRVTAIILDTAHYRLFRPAAVIKVQMPRHISSNLILSTRVLMQ